MNEVGRALWPGPKAQGRAEIVSCKPWRWMWAGSLTEAGPCIEVSQIISFIKLNWVLNGNYTGTTLNINFLPQNEHTLKGY